MHNWLLLNLLAVNPYFRLSLISSMETFGQESLFSLRPGNQRDLWPDRHLTADQTGWVPLEWHLEPLQGMRAPTDLQSSESVRVKGEGENEVLQTQLVWKKVEPSSTSVLWRTDPRAVGSVSFVIILKFGHYPLTAICAEAEISIYIGTPSKTASDTFLHDFSFLHSHFLQ